MKITSVATSLGGPTEAATRTWQVQAVAGEAPFPWRQQLLYLRFSTGGMAEGMIVDGAATRLEARFRPYEYRAPLEAAPISAEAMAGAHQHTTVLVETHSHSTALTEELRAQRAGQAREIAVGAEGAFGGVLAHSFPTNPRIGIGGPEDAVPAEFFWQAPGQVGESVPSEQGIVHAGEALAGALQRLLDRLFEAGPQAQPYVDVALTFASDAQCVLDITAFEVSYRLVRRSFPTGAEKQALRFAGDRVVSQQAMIEMPGNAAVTSALLRTAAAFPADRLVVSGQGSGALEATPPQKGGACVGPDRRAAQAFTPAEAISISGLALGVMAAAGGTELQVELREDYQGGPAGKKLAEGTVKLEQAGRREWTTLLFADPLIVPAQAHWILVRAARGQAVWLADTGSTPVRLLTPTGQGEWIEAGELDGFQALYRFYSRSQNSPQVQGQTPVTLAVGGNAVAATPPPDPAEGGTEGALSFDLRSALNGCLSPQAAPDTRAAVALEFSSGLPGILTVYPPTVEYEI